MKKRLSLNIVFVFLTIFTSELIVAQQTHEITLYVDTEKIDMRNLDRTCNFGQDPSISNEAYTVDIKVGDTIIWKGVSTSNPDDKVEIRKIVYSSGTNFFNSKILRHRGGVVTADIANGEPGDYQKYNIEFKVERNGRMLGDTFPIDPKLRMKRL